MTTYLKIGQEKFVKARLTDASSSVNTDVISTWSSSNSCVSVFPSLEDPNNATVKGVTAGTAIITATSSNSVSGTITVTVHTGVTTTVSITD